MEKRDDDYLRGDGKFPLIAVESENLAEAMHNSIIACHEKGARVETPKHRPGMSLGYGADIIIRVNNPDSEPKIYSPAIHDDGRGVLQYILEMTHGIHNHWKKDEEHPERWGYTYNERFVDQLPFVFQRIKDNWDRKGRITGRDFQFVIWRPEEDIIVEQDDPPCFNIGQLRFLKNSDGETVMSYLSDWRSRDQLKGWNENVVGQIGCEEVPGLMRLLRDKVSNMLGIPIKFGSYHDRSRSLHLYGLYIDRDGLEQKVEQMKRDGYEARSMSLGDYLTLQPDLDSSLPWPGTIDAQKRLIACQMDYEEKTGNLNASRRALIDAGYDLDTFLYPEEWDTWPKSWDAEPDPSKLARIVS